MASLLITKRGGVEARSYQMQVCFEHRRYKLLGWDTDSTGERLSAKSGRNVEKYLACKAGGEIRLDSAAPSKPSRPASGGAWPDKESSTWRGGTPRSR